MLTAGIASSDSHTSGQLLAALQQTGLVASVKQWTLPLSKLPDGSEGMPDLVLLDLGRDAEPYFVFGAHVRRLRPAIRLIACSAAYPPGQALLLDAMRSGVQDFIAKPVTLEALRDIVARFYEEGRPAETRSAEKLIVLMGSKGGVGTTTVAVNLGVQLCTFYWTCILDSEFGTLWTVSIVWTRTFLEDCSQSTRRNWKFWEARYNLKNGKTFRWLRCRES
jgi:CheY-like chemotaxis protein